MSLRGTRDTSTPPMTVGSFICSPSGLVQDHVAHFVAFFLPSDEFLSPCSRLLLVLFSVGLLLVLACELIPTMGQTSSKSKPPLDLVLSHFQDFRNAAAFFATHMRIRVICSAEWPAFQVGWPPKGSFDRKLILRIQDMVLTIQTRSPTLWPHAVFWSTPPSWLKTLILSSENKIAILLAQQRKSKEKPRRSDAPAVLPSPSDPELLTPLLLSITNEEHLSDRE